MAKGLTNLRQLDQPQFHQFCGLIYKTTGIHVSENRMTLLSNRIRRRLQEGQSFEDYFKLITSPQGSDEAQRFIDAITTNETFFFRTDAHFEWLRTQYLTEVVSAALRGKRQRSLRIWSAGCATGAEPYSIAICLLENRARLRDWDLKVVGTDISEHALEEARIGSFRARAVEAVSQGRFRRFFEEPDEDQRWQVTSEVKDLVELRPHNLLTPMADGPFDCVFIRNVLIYFDKASKQIAIRNLIDALAPGGYLVVGPSEGIYNMLEPLERVKPFLYQKPLTT